MKSDSFTEFINDHFMLFTCVLSGVMAGLYVWKGIKEGFPIGNWIMVVINLVYIPFVLIFKRKCFSYFYLVYSVILVFLIAFEETFFSIILRRFFLSVS